MEDHLSPLGASFLYLEEPTTVMHVGSVLVLQPGPQGFDSDRLTQLVASRVAGASRYRQKVRELPGRIASPFWVDAADFDLTYHVRFSALPRPGTPEQLEEFVARILSRPLDRAHPLWELYVVEGLEGGRVAIVTKTHQAVVDGIAAVDIAQLLLDDDPDVRPDPVPEIDPKREPTDLELLAGTAIDIVARPNRWAGLVVGSVAEVATMTKRVLCQTRNVATAVARTATDPAPTSPLNVRVGVARRVRFMAVPLDSFRAVRDDYQRLREARDCTVTDVILTVLTGALRTWLQSRGEPVHGAARVRALVPVSVSERDGDVGFGSSVRACFVDLPVGEPNPVMRLEQVTFQMRQQVRGGRAVGARALSDIAGFAPTTLHHLGAQLGNAASRRFFNLVVTNVPGPQHPLWVAGSRMIVSYPVIPLALGQALAVGLTSYDGTVGVGLNGDRGAMHDLDAFTEYLGDALTELSEALTAEVGDPGWTEPKEPAVRATRVYLALGAAGLSALADAGRLEPGAVRASAVTKTVRAAFPSDDEEELEYDAMLIAAEMLGEQEPGGRIVVAAADLPAAEVREVSGAGAYDGYEVALGAVTVDRVVALHVADPGAAADDELSWYDASELHRLAAGQS
ncbi:MAG: wax ester/triacylglycerol synthase family O-acyltransferase [Austwickia sp.]|nr:wax ester/triacylglycerol synthase family O-acyltransferase [Actinomycetota bacterium]MCB1254448.1 wax ester/triacylglycerol synthase family O-acyltransferase [Austwickia sp.]